MFLGTWTDPPIGSTDQRRVRAIINALRMAVRPPVVPGSHGSDRMRRSPPPGAPESGQSRRCSEARRATVGFRRALSSFPPVKENVYGRERREGPETDVDPTITTALTPRVSRDLSGEEWTLWDDPPIVLPLKNKELLINGNSPLSVAFLSQIPAIQVPYLQGTVPEGPGGAENALRRRKVQRARRGIADRRVGAEIEFEFGNALDPLVEVQRKTGEPGFGLYSWQTRNPGLDTV
jgi:hypothetical protein